MTFLERSEVLTQNIQDRVSFREGGRGGGCPPLEPFFSHLEIVLLKFIIAVDSV